MRKLLMSLLMAGSLLTVGIGAALADDASAPAAASAPDTTASAPAASDAAASAPAADASAAPAASAPADASAAAAASDAAPAAPTAPFSVDSSKISSGDTAWMLTSTALVLFMTIPGLALFYAGMVRKKNVLATVMQSFAITCIVTVIWTVVGYSLAFTPGGSFLGGFSRVMLHGMAFIKGDKATTLTVSHLAPTIPESVYFVYQMTFAIITPALITGAFADRMKFSAMLIFMTLWSIIVYSPIAHMVWEPTGWLATAGILDFAGGTVVHINAGIAGLVCCLVLGKRTGYGKDSMAPHNLVLTMIGGSMLWVGWFGFNAGSAVAADGRAGFAMLTTQVATAIAALGWMFAEWIAKGKPSVLGIVSGAVAGLVAITPASGFVGVGGALAIGLIAGVVCFWSATWLKHKMGYDDSLDAFGVHCIGGIVGAILTGVFAVKDIGGADGSVLLQLKGVVTTLVYSGVISFILLKIIDVTIGLRVTEEEEREGLDVILHGEHVE
ncbi:MULTISPECIES: ammonium transporter [Paraburkholderia]|jgi:Amt family ammonium transporter|uniref:Ammonium transporter n=1 Tax=Paraburkholderia caribensis TaxID=75105 RepID=A0A9Q6S0G0_9BURK|nr:MULTISPECIES: ammonium transporter [Paraburkholderia]ALP61224.1 ammonia channel protein [Paraburkholderia caribensis]AMV41355.1 ammonia channel protein [Paraburkholderia caribensis]AUT50653.1 ammonia channel protein [Paraburkholderia caribensis]MCO4875562.1 ammonium transporter [Paraburkholderia caribensis]MDR6379781.1 Amt family ammonium transporter [Paraburkholderia caribensis]